MKLKNAFAHVLTLCFLAAIGVAQERRTIPGEITVIRKAEGTAHYVVERTKPTVARKEAFDSQRLEKELGIHKKIDAQEHLMRNIYEAQEKAAAERQRTQIVRAPKLNKIKLFGKETEFYEGPPMPGAMETQSPWKTLTSNVLINGKQVDTIFAGDSFTLSFSLAPNTVSAVFNFYADVNQNGLKDSSDVPFISNGLLLDNDENDLDPADGQYSVKFSRGSWFSNILATLIVEVNDFRSLSSAKLTIREREQGKVIVGTVKPVFKNTLVMLDSYSSGWYRIVFPDTAGEFTVHYDTTGFYPAYIRVYNLDVTPNGFVPPQDTTITLNRDTTRVVRSYTQATAFIEGYVKDQNGGPVQKALVSAYYYSGMYGRRVSVTAISDNAGYYRLGVSGNVGSYWYLNATATDDYVANNYTSYRYVYVGENQTVRQDFVLTKANSLISGLVKYGAIGIGGMPISASMDSLSNITLTAANGNYSLNVYKPNAVTAKYSVHANYYANYSSYYIDTTYRPDIPAGAANVNFEMKKIAGGAQGRITDARTGAPVRNASLSFSGPAYRYVATDDSGYYRARLLDGTYSLSVSAALYEGFNDNNITIAGTVITKNISLSRMGSFSGLVTDESGLPISYAYVTPTDNYGYAFGTAYTDLEGRYIVGGLQTSSYKARASASGYIAQWYNKKLNSDSAQSIPVTKGFDTPNINFVLSRGGSISGKVKNKSGAGIVNVFVTVLDTFFYSIAGVQTGDSGNYSITGLYTGMHYVKTSDERFLDQWYNGATDYNKARKVPVTIYQNTPDISFTLTTGATIAGKVTNKMGSSIPYVSVNVLDSNYYYLRYGSANDSGFYQVNRLEAGKRLYVTAQAYEYAQRWYNNVSTPDSATFLVLQGEERRDNINFTLPKAGKITGTVTNTAGAPIPYASVNAVQTNGYSSFYGSSDQLGNYIISNLSTGKYKIRASAYEHSDQWYNRKSSAALADTIVVEEEEIVSGINFQLKPLVTDSVVVKIVVDDLPDSLQFSQSHVPDNAIDYLWGIRFDVYYDSSGSDPFETEIALMHAKSAGESEFRSDLIAATQHVMIRWFGNYGYNTHSNVRVWRNPAEKNSLYLAAPKSWFEIQGVNTNTKFYGRSLYYGTGGQVTDKTGTGTGETTVFDVKGDVPNAFADILSAGWNIQIPTVVVGKMVAAKAGVMYATQIAQLEGSLWSIGLTTGSLTSIGAVSVSDIRGLAIHPSTNSLYGVSSTQTNTTLYRISCDSGATVPVTNVGVDDIRAIAFSRGDTLYGGTSTGKLYRINLASGEAVLVGTAAGLNYWGLSFSPTSGKLWASARNFDDSIYTVNTYTGAAKSVGGLGFAAIPRSIAFNPTGVLYCLIDNGLGEDYLATLDTLNGAVTLVSSDPLSVKNLSAIAMRSHVGTSTIQEGIVQLPKAFSLSQNYPNPFNPSTVIRYGLPTRSRVKLQVYDMLGREIVTLVNEEQEAQYCEKTWYATVSSGLYFYRLEAVSSEDPNKSFVQVRKMLMLK